ncbi:hypothetical protein CapIbe_013212 [Capra ibex]
MVGEIRRRVLIALVIFSRVPGKQQTHSRNDGETKAQKREMICPDHMCHPEIRKDQTENKSIISRNLHSSS